MVRRYTPRGPGEWTDSETESEPDATAEREFPALGQTTSQAESSDLTASTARIRTRNPMNFLPSFCTAKQPPAAMGKEGPTFSDALRHPRRPVQPVDQAASAQSGQIVRLQSPLTIRRRGLSLAASPPEQSQSHLQASNGQDEISSFPKPSTDAYVKGQEIPHSGSSSDFEKIEVDTAKSCSDESDAAGSPPEACSEFITGAVNGCWDTSGSASAGGHRYGSLEHAASYLKESFLEVSNAFYSEKRATDAVDFKEELLSVLHKYERRLRSQK